MSRALLALAVLCTPLVAQESPANSIPVDGNPLASTAEKLFPSPCRFFQRPDPESPTGVRNAYPAAIMATPRGARPIDFARFNRGDGHSPVAPILVHFGVDVADRFLVDQHNTPRSLRADAPIALFDMTSGDAVPVLTEMDQNLRSVKTSGRHALIIRPMVPLAMGARHVVVLSRDLRDTSDKEIPTPPGFAALRDGVPTSHEALEGARAAYDELFGFLEARGHARGDILLAFDFVVASRQHVLGGILSMREQALAQAAKVELGHRIDEVSRAPNENVALLVQGEFEVPCFLDEHNAIERRPDGSAVLQEETRWFPFSMVVPPQVAAGDPLPLVLFGHGIFGSGQRYLTGRLGTERIQPIARRGGAVVVATDFIGLSRGDRDLVARELIGDLNRVHVVTDRLQQSLINNLILVETVLARIQRDPKLGLEGRPLLAPDRVAYYGVSLGGTQGVSLVALSPRITRAFLAVPGGAWSAMLSRSIVFRPFKILVDGLYPDPLLQQAFQAMVQGRFDGCDGVNLGGLLFRDPLPHAPRERRVVLLEAIGDCQVPNLTTRMLARAIGVRQLAPVVEAVFGLEPVSGPTRQPVLAQVLMRHRVESYRPPDQNLMPQQDNGTHSQSVRLESTVEQLLAFLLAR